MKYMTEYDLQANNFLATTNTTLEITRTKIVCTELANRWRAHRWQYYCKLRRGHKTYSFPFYDSVANYEKGERPTKYDVLACLDTYDYICGIEDFANEFGYDLYEDYKETEKIYKACMKQGAKLHGLFTDEELEMLAAIN